MIYSCRMSRCKCTDNGKNCKKHIESNMLIKAMGGLVKECDVSTFHTV